MRPSALLLVLLCACSSAPVEGPGTLLDATPIDAGVNTWVLVELDVQLFCGPNGPMRDISSATGDLGLPDGGHQPVTPTWTTAAREMYDCTQDEWQRVSHVHLGFTPDAPGTWKASVTLLPGVGTFERDVLVQ